MGLLTLVDSFRPDDGVLLILATEEGTAAGAELAGFSAKFLRLQG
jgi:hypothetical protein